MAVSGRFLDTTGDANMYLDWERIEVDILNNRSKLKLTLTYYTTLNESFSYRVQGFLGGRGLETGGEFSYSGGLQGPGTIVLNTREVWVTHNQDGTKNQYLYGNAEFSYMVPTGYADIEPIPRMSTISSFSVANHLKPNTSNTINLGLDRPKTEYRHDIELRDGSTVLRTWTNQINPTALTITSTVVNTLLSRMGSSTERVLTLRVTTKLDGTIVGESVNATTTVTVHDDTKPVVSGLSVLVYGNGLDNSMNTFVQGFSRVTASFSASGVGGASIVSRKIEIKKVTGGGNLQTINAGSGTTNNAVTLSGLYEAVATAVDTRGKSNTQRITFNVAAYSPPNISNFKTTRSTSAPATVIMEHEGSWSRISGNNVTNTLSTQIHRRRGTGSWFSVDTSTQTSTTGVFDRSINSTGNLVTASYDFRLTITDSFGNVATSISTISTQKVLFDFYRDIGIGIGKTWERGVLDIGGDVYINDALLGGGKAKDVILESSNFNSNNVEGGMDELFTNVSSGKNLIGGAITDVDNSIVIPTNPTFQQLANAVGQISTGSQLEFGLQSYSSNVNYSISGLGFRPVNLLIVPTFSTSGASYAKIEGRSATSNNINVTITAGGFSLTFTSGNSAFLWLATD